MYQATTETLATLHTLREIASREAISLPELISIVLVGELHDIRVAIDTHRAAVRQKEENTAQMFSGLLDTIQEIVGAQTGPDGQAQLETQINALIVRANQDNAKINGLSGILASHAQDLQQLKLSVGGVADHLGALQQLGQNVLNTLQEHAIAIAAIAGDSTDDPS